MNLNKPSKHFFKVKVKVTVPYLDKKGKQRASKQWVHFAYIDTKLYIEYLKTLGDQDKSERVNVQESIERWFAEDFGGNLLLDNIDDLDHVRHCIMESMKPEFPDLYRDDYSIDKQGWVKLWTTRHIKRDLEEYHGK